MGQEQITTQGSAGTTVYVLADNLGSVRDVVNTSSTVVDHIVYNSFGQVAYESNTAIAHWAGFAGYHTDANTGLDYNDHRWYDPLVGRWISEDPLGFGGGDANVSRYVGNGSTNAVDSSGLAWGWPSWDDYVHYFNHPFEMDTDLQIALVVSLGVTIVAGSMIAGVVAVSGVVAAAPHVAAAYAYGSTYAAAFYILHPVAVSTTAWAAFGAGMAGANGGGPWDIGLSAVAGGMGGYMGSAGMGGGGTGGNGSQTNCFVAGTQVVIGGGQLGAIGEVSARPEPLPELPASDAETWNRWLWSLVVVGVGIAGYRAGRLRRRRDEDVAAELVATEALFHELEEDDMLREGTGDRLQGTDAEGTYMAPDQTIDELCDALFHADVGQVSNLPYPVEWAPHSSSVGWSPSAKPLSRVLSKDAVAIAPGPVRKQFAPVSRRQPTPFRSRPVPRSRNRLGIVWLAASVLFAGWLGFGTIGHDSAPPKPAAPGPQLVAAAASALPAAAPRTKNIEDIRVGDRVVAGNPTDELDLSLGSDEPDAANWRKLVLRAPKADGSWSDIELLRPTWWIEQETRRVAGRVWISVPDCGIDADAELLDVQPCPPIANGSGRVVTGRFAHSSAEVIDLHVEGLDAPIGTTANHRFWCENRHAFVPAAELQVGDELWSLRAAADVLAVNARARSERVYNLEIQFEHVYRVTRDGLLVHNAGLCPSAPGVPNFYVSSNGTVYPVPAIQAGTPVYRLWGGTSGPMSPYWSPYNPASVPNYPGAAGLPPGNTGQFVSTGVITNPAGITVGPAAPIGSNPGGMPQFVIPNPQAQVQVNVVSGGSAPAQ